MNLPLKKKMICLTIRKSHQWECLKTKKWLTMATHTLLICSLVSSLLAALPLISKCPSVSRCNEYSLAYTWSTGSHLNANTVAWRRWSPPNVLCIAWLSESKGVSRYTWVTIAKFTYYITIYQLPLPIFRKRRHLSTLAASRNFWAISSRFCRWHRRTLPRYLTSVLNIVV